MAILLCCAFKTECETQRTQQTGKEKIYLTLKSIPGAFKPGEVYRQPPWSQYRKWFPKLHVFLENSVCSNYIGYALLNIVPILFWSQFNKNDVKAF